MNDNDKKIRKQWLVVFIVFTLINCTATLLRFLFDPAIANLLQVNFIFTTAFLSSIVAFSFIFYRYIYKKPGTKLLVFCLTMTMIALVVTPILYLTGKTQPTFHIPYYGAYVIISHVMSVVWLVVCWRMRKTNLRLQKL